LLCRYAHLAYRPTGHSLPEAWPPEPIGFMAPTDLDFLFGLDHSAATIRGSGT